MQQDDIDKAIENLDKSYKLGHIQGTEFNSQYVDIKLKAQQNELNKILIQNINKSNELIAGLQQEIQRSTKSINDSNKALSDQQSRQNKWSVGCNAVLAIVSIFSLGVAWDSVRTTNLAAIQTANAAQAQLRPYVTVEPVFKGVSWISQDHIEFNFVLKNIGQTPALKILKGYNSFLQTKDGKSTLVQPFREKAGDEDALSPTQTSATQPFDIYVAGFKPNQNMAIKVEILISYEGFQEIDSKRYLSKAIYIITPIAGDYFTVSQPKLFFGLEKEGW